MLSMRIESVVGEAGLAKSSLFIIKVLSLFKAVLALRLRDDEDDFTSKISKTLYTPSI